MELAQALQAARPQDPVARRDLARARVKLGDLVALGGNRSEVQRIDRTPIRMTAHRTLALVMGRFTAEDTVKSIQNSRRSPELVPVQV